MADKSSIQGTLDFLKGYNSFGVSLIAQDEYMVMDKENLRRIDFYSGFNTAKAHKLIERENAPKETSKKLSQKQVMFLYRFAKKYIQTDSKSLFPHIDLCFQVVRGEMTILEFEKATGIILANASLEDRFQIGL